MTPASSTVWGAAARLVMAFGLAGLAACAPAPARVEAKPGSPGLAFQLRGTQRPAIVLQSGLGDGQATWARLQARLPAAQQVFAYDRPGYGDSPALNGPHDPCSTAQALHAALQAAGLAPPYLLVGHSLGGLYQYAFAKLYPAEVAGLLLLDPTHPQHWARMQARAPGAAAALRGLRATLFSSAMRQEFDDQAVCTDALAGLPSPVVPMRLLARGRPGVGETPEFQRMTWQLADDWQNLLPGLQRTDVADAGHYIHVDATEQVAQAVQALLDAARPRP